MALLGLSQCHLYYLYPCSLHHLELCRCLLWWLLLFFVVSTLGCEKGIFRIVSKISSFLKWCVLLHARYFMTCKLSHRCSHSVNVLSPVYFRNSPQLLCLNNLLFVTTVQFLRYMCIQFFLSITSVVDIEIAPTSSHCQEGCLTSWYLCDSFIGTMLDHRVRVL